MVAEVEARVEAAMAAHRAAMLDHWAAQEQRVETMAARLEAKLAEVESRTEDSGLVERLSKVEERVGHFRSDLAHKAD